MALRLRALRRWQLQGGHAPAYSAICVHATCSRRRWSTSEACSVLTACASEMLASGSAQRVSGTQWHGETCAEPGRLKGWRQVDAPPVASSSSPPSSRAASAVCAYAPAVDMGRQAQAVCAALSVSQILPTNAVSSADAFESAVTTIFFGGMYICSTQRLSLQTRTRIFWEPALHRPAAMGMNGGHKAAQAARGSGGGGGGGPDDPQDGRVDGAFHSPAFLAAHIQSLQETERVSWEDFKAKQIADAAVKAAAAEDEDRAQLEFRALLDADRQKRLDAGRKEARAYERGSSKKAHALMRLHLRAALFQEKKRHKKERDGKKRKSRKEGKEEKARFCRRAEVSSLLTLSLRVPAQAQAQAQPQAQPQPQPRATLGQLGQLGKRLE